MLVAWSGLTEGHLALRLHDTSRISSPETVKLIPEDFGGQPGSLTSAEELRNSASFLGAVVSHARACMRYAEAAELVRLLSGLIGLGFKPDADWADLLLDRVALGVTVMSQVAVQEQQQPAAWDATNSYEEVNSSSTKPNSSSSSMEVSDIKTTSTSSNGGSSSSSSFQPSSSALKRLESSWDLTPDSRPAGSLAAWQTDVTDSAEPGGVHSLGLPPDPTKNPSWQRYRIISAGYAGWSGSGNATSQRATAFGGFAGNAHSSSSNSFDQLLQQAAQSQAPAPDAAVIGLHSLAASGTVVQTVCEVLWLAAAAGFAVKSSTADQLMAALRGHCRAMGRTELQQLLAGLSMLSSYIPEPDCLVEVLAAVCTLPTWLSAVVVLSNSIGPCLR
jgi:hypothetical protein